MEKETCVRCNKPTAYDISTPITMRRWYVEGAGQKWTRMLEETVRKRKPIGGRHI